MRPISDAIEDFIKALMAEEQAQIELKRNELAEYFNCAPSQINYVLATRFTPSHGYITESRRGGGGYIRVIRITHEGVDYYEHLLAQLGPQVSQTQAAAVIQDLGQRGKITPGEAKLMLAATHPQAVQLPLAIKDTLRAHILRNMILALAYRTEEE